MWLMIVVSIVIFIVAVICIPLKVKIDYTEEEKKRLDIKNKIEIYILGFVKIKTIHLNQEDKIKKKGQYQVNATYQLLSNYLGFLKQEELYVEKNNLKKIFHSIFYENLDISIGFNLQEPILNAYLMALINTVLNIFFAINASNINLKNINYITYVSNDFFHLQVKGIIKFRIVNNIITIIKIVKRIREVKKKNGKTTSNRFAYANRNDIH